MGYLKENGGVKVIEAFEIDEKGFIVNSVLIEKNANTNLIKRQLPYGIHKPKWNGNEWVESLEKIELEKIKVEHHLKEKNKKN